MKRVIALGVFDGGHRGHAGLLHCCRAEADRLGASAAVLTFDLHPDLVVGGADLLLINTPEDRAEVLRRVYGMDEVLFLHFDRATMDMTWERFLSDYLVQKLGAVHLICGHDFRFGRGGAGTAEKLAAFCRAAGVGCSVIPKIELDGITVSSTYIRGLIEAGQIERANEFLGHPYSMTGTVVHGNHLGRTMGIPTANLTIPDGVLTPALGAYAARVWVDGSAYAAVTNVGVRPTVMSSGGVSVESWLQDFSGDLYGRQIRLELYHYLRGEEKFDSLEALKAQIHRDAERTKQYFA